MPLLFSIPTPGEEIVRALNWTLLHSVWQGMLLSMVAGFIVFFTKKTSPSLRYNLLTASLLVFIIGIAATFNLQIIKAKQVVNTVQTMSATETFSTETAISPVMAENKLSITAKAIVFLNANANWIVSAWLLIIGLQFIRLTAGLYGVFQLKRRQVFCAGDYWDNRISALSRQLKINKRVQLLQSGIAKMPAVIGYFKPVVLFPIGMLSSLPANEVEGILIHELAHIHRKDFLVNVLQSIIEIIFFFNPAVLWVSSLIKTERENCCDDIAVSQSDSKQNYIKALMSFQDFNTPGLLPLANAFSGEKKHLMNRIKRIIYNHNKTLNNMEKKFLAAGMIIISAFIFAFSSNDTQFSNDIHRKGIEKKIVSQAIAIPTPEKNIAAMAMASDTVPVPGREDNFNGKISTTVDGKKYIMVTENDQVTELYVNGKKIPAEKMGEYKNITTKLLKQIKLDAMQSAKEWEQAAFAMEQSKKEMEQSEIEIEQSKIAMDQAKKEMWEQKEQLGKEMELSKIAMEQSKIKMEQAEMEMEQAERIGGEKDHTKKEIELSKIARDQSKIEREQAQKQILQSKKEMALAYSQMAQARKGMADDTQLAKKNMELAQKQMLQSKIDMEKSMKDMEQSKKDMEQAKRLQEKIVADFIKENIIKDKNELSSYKLNNEELIVNGIKQPDTIFKKFKEKYVTGNNWSINYSNNDEIK